MKNNLLFTLYLFVAFNSSSLICQSNTEIGYNGLSKNYDLSYLNKDCARFIYDNTLVQADRLKPCTLTFQFSSVGDTIINILTRDSIVLESFQLDIKELPDIKAQIAKVYNGYLKLDIFKIQVGIYTSHNNFEFKEDIKIVSYKIEQFRDRNRIFKRMNLRGRFNSEIQNLFKRANIGDRIIFSEITIQVGDFNPIEIENISIRLTD